MIIDRLEEDDFEEDNHILRSRPFGFLLAFQRTTAQRNFLSSCIYFNQWQHRALATSTATLHWLEGQSAPKKGWMVVMSDQKLSQFWIGKTLPNPKTISKFCQCVTETVFSLKVTSILKFSNGWNWKLIIPHCPILLMVDRYVEGWNFRCAVVHWNAGKKPNGLDF